MNKISLNKANKLTKQLEKELINLEYKKIIK